MESSAHRHFGHPNNPLLHYPHSGLVSPVGLSPSFALTARQASNLEFRTRPIYDLSYGDSKANESNRRILPIRLTGSGPVSTRPEEAAFLLLIKPAEEFLKSRIGLDFLD